ncbi:unnamed protein product [Rodentolepis nana]|uniref:DUF4133 domain-containing protein n=1 Tax=Rodentolepis nana TaxID=102285 RepID=A0A0R3TWW7_RODNA|nr:unnamed protein product [Rodentolepis nana]
MSYTNNIAKGRGLRLRLTYLSLGLCTTYSLRWLWLLRHTSGL